MQPIDDARDPVAFALPDVGDLEAEAVAATIRSGWITSGPAVSAFESEFAGYVGGSVEAVAVNSATAGLHLALEAIGVGPGDEVIVPTWTFTATAEAVTHVGATPVLVDVCADTLNISPDSFAAAITSRTRAVIPVHLAGRPADIPALRQIIGDRAISIIEDAAHALPTVGTAGMVGACEQSDAAVFSFYATKTLTTGEGGMVTTANPEIAARCRLMRLHGIDRDAYRRDSSSRASWAYNVEAPGFKYNMPDTAAAMGRVQLSRVDSMHARRAEIAEDYLTQLKDLDLSLPTLAPISEVHSWHLFMVRLTETSGITRSDFIDKLAAAGVATSVHYIPLHEHSAWHELVVDPARTLPNAVAAAPYSVSLPIFSKMTGRQVDRVVSAVRSVFG